MKNETPAAQNQNFINNTDEKLYNTYLVNSQTCDITPPVNEARKKNPAENQYQNDERINIVLGNQQKHVENISRKGKF